CNNLLFIIDNKNFFAHPNLLTENCFNPSYPRLGELKKKVIYCKRKFTNDDRQMIHFTICLQFIHISSTCKDYNRICKAHYLQKLGDRKSTRLNSSHVSISYAV